MVQAKSGWMEYSAGEETGNHSSSCAHNKTDNHLRTHGHLKLPCVGIEASSPTLLQKWSILMKEEISCGDCKSWSNERKIMLAPKALRDVCPDAYSPQLLCIGPLTAPSASDTLSSMDRCKAHYVNTFLDRMGCSSCPFQLEDLMPILFDEDPNPGAAYFDIPDHFDIETLRLLVAVDSVVILEFFTFLDKNVKSSAYNICRPFINSVTIWQMKRDLFIIGNQVPLSNLVRLAEYQGLISEEWLHHLHFLIWNWSPFTSEKSKAHYAHFHKLFAAPSLLECEHLLACLYQACVKNLNEKPKSSNHADSIPGASDQECKAASGSLYHRPFVKNSRRKPETVEMGKFPRASELRKVGVKFKGVNGNATVIGYDENKLTVELPRLVVEDATECTLRNLLAYELTSKEEEDICAYLCLMSDLIENTDDLHILYQAGMLQNYLGSDEKLIAMWNEMCVNTQLYKHERLAEMTRAIMSHYDTNWRKIYVEFHRRYFSRPWLIVSTVAAMLLLFMTTLQTVYTAMGFYKG